MRQFRVPGSRPQAQIGLSGAERKRLLYMVVGLVLCVVLLATSVMKARGYRIGEGGEMPPDERTPEFTESVFVPTIDAASIDAAVADGLPRDRVILEGEALDIMLGYARRMTTASFAALNAEELDVEGVARLEAEPGAFRGRAFTARGRIESLRSRRRGVGEPEEHIGRMILEDGEVVYFLALDVPDLGGFVRLDGLFLKIFNDESSDEPGTWIEGPLLVGPRAIRSFPEVGPVPALDRGLLAAVEDDVLIPADGSTPRISGIPYEPLWHMMAMARDLEPGSVAWEAAPELDAAAIERLLDDGASYRGEPFRIPLSRLQGVRVRSAEENPARLPKFSEGWIGNTTWKHVIHFRAPYEFEKVQLRDHVFAEGFFLKNFAYESSGRGLRIAPVFVLASMTKLVVEDDPLFARIAYVIAGASLALTGVFVVLLLRDRRRSRQLQADLRRRRQARREKGDTMGGTATP